MNGLMCWSINQLPGKDDLPISQELILGLTLFCMLGISFCSNQSSSSQTTSETTNRAWLIGLPPVIGSIVLFLLLKGDHLPSDLAQYAGYASLFLFLIGTLLPTLIAFLQIRQNPLTTPSISSNLTPEAYKNRQALLNKVKNYWIKGVLEGSLSNRAPIELELEERFDAVQLDWQTPEQPRRSLPKGTKAINQFDKMGKGCTMLILGEPGSGKTTTLLEMAEKLIQRAEQNTELPIPVVFNLSSWAATKKQSLTEWLLEELKTRYQIPQKIRENWLKNQDLLLLLDGLDEVAKERRNDCVLAINDFKNSYGTTEIIVCSRFKDYKFLSTRLQFQGAIFIKDLTPEQISDYFDQVGEQLQGVKEVWVNDEVLQELTKTPLMLSIIAITYEGISATELPQMPLEKRRDHLFNQYIQKMLNRRQQNQPYSNQKTLHWLNWLSKNMSTKSQTVFLIEGMQPSWLSEKEKKIYSFFCAIYVIFILFVLGFSLNNIGLLSNYPLTVVALIVILVVVLLIVILTNLFLDKEGKKLFNFLIRSIKLLLMSFNAAVIIKWLFEYFQQDNTYIESRAKTNKTFKPNQEIWASLKISLFLLCFLTLLFSLAFGYVLGWKLMSLFQGIVLAVSVAILSPQMVACIQHLALRVTLTLSGKTPWNYAKFLDYATERIFLQKIGGGYIFIHRMLLEHFASLEP
ncbi:NACHT domain-containing NTPase [Oscillatoria sp. HE19RPO]|uniref:NACHT domain-containing protein n=1 Tax=Oscillatoria sp. HE19RPO TaxID=2954806 RepID=UPI0020C42E2A|nr:NACHT domain-containing protein [Oscillatoria sp. HE19RPO]